MANLPSPPPAGVMDSGLRNPGVLADYKPEFNGKKFKCPRCSVVAAQAWTGIFKKTPQRTPNGYVAREVMISDLGLSTCDACGASCLWFEGQLVYPSQAIAHQVPEDLPAEVRKDFEEAAAIAGASPRAAAALLRMCIEGLCKKVAGKDKFEDAIVELERQGIPTPVTVALDVVRLTGNEALHGGRLYGSDDAKTVATLFRLASLIVSWAITEKKELQELVSSIGPEKFARIEEQRQKAAEKASKTK
ncbi:MAG: DUF4145 domain-containing protein [Mesorhizobium sp.]|uniref:DUF4145 domain-containing protein n=1 Tax=Mesorhizobium sp. TaxID=1871066 RepID=UPI000FE76D64|nr:DUF4145 domain-containing protein [Mesorhizobium sp.]RWM97685.1 MAG: DUF4145 domain-containing protein [Mesorhizobium sp.]